MLGAAATVAVAHATRPEWKPKLGVLGSFTEANVRFAHDEGFTNMILEGGGGSTLDAEKITDERIEQVKAIVNSAGLHVSALQITQNHIDPDPARRARLNAYFVKAIEMAGKLGVPYIGSASGKYPGKPFAEQVDEIVRVYNEQYFPACQKYNVRILWEPWPEGPNIATSPAGYEALFKAFGDAPVGLQYDPSHLVRQFMDPIATARDFASYIHDVHLKDTEIMWPELRQGGINPVDGRQWWRYRLPGLGSINWAEFFTVLQNKAYQGAMSIEHEDELYGCCAGPEFSADYKEGFRMAHRYLRQYVPD